MAEQLRSSVEARALLQEEYAQVGLFWRLCRSGWLALSMPALLPRQIAGTSDLMVADAAKGCRCCKQPCISPSRLPA